MEHRLASLARTILHHRRAVLVLVLVVTAVMAAGLSRIRADFTPSDLFARVEEEEVLAAEFRATFGNTDNVLLVVVQADDVLSLPALQHVHSLSRALAELPWAHRVQSLTTLPLPVPVGPTEVDEEALGDDTRLAMAWLRAQHQTLQQHLDGLAREAPAWQLTLKPVPDTWGAWGEPLQEGEMQGARPAVTGDVVTADEAARIREAVATSLLLTGRLIGRSGQTAAIVVSLDGSRDRARDVEAAVRDARALVLGMEPPQGVEVSWGGLPWLRTALVERMRRDQGIMLPSAIGICILILLGAFRWLPGVALPLGVVVATVLILTGGMGWVGEPFNILNNILPLMLIVIGISDSIHLLTRYGEELRDGHGQDEAVERSLGSIAWACLMTSITTSVGFGTLVVSSTSLLQRFGVTAALGVMVAYVVTITLIPVCLHWVKPPSVTSGAGREGWFEDTIEAGVGAVLRRPWAALVVSVGLFAGAGWLASQVRVDSAVLDQFSEDEELYRTTRLIEEDLQGFRPLEIYLEAAEGDGLLEPDVSALVDRIARWAQRQEGVLGVTSWLDWLREVRAMALGDESLSRPFGPAQDTRRWLDAFRGSADDPTRAYLSDDRQQGRIQLAIEDFGAQRTIALGEALQQELDTLLADVPGVRARLTGDAWTSSRGLRSVVGDLAGSLGLASLFIFLLLSWLLRSPMLGLLSIPPNVLPLLFTLAFMGWQGIPLNAATVIIFSISVGLAVDGTIHVLARYREERGRGLDLDQAMRKAARGTGKAIVLTALSLMLGFSVMLLSAFVPVQRFGILVGISMVSCLVSTLFLLPALLKVFLRR
jgi:predicted RND superfamily exporter protein